MKSAVFSNSGLWWLARFFRFRVRYFLTRHNRLRLRYVFPCAVFVAAYLSTGLFWPAGGEDRGRPVSAQYAAADVSSGSPEYAAMAAAQRRFARQASDFSLAPAAPETITPRQKTLEIGKGDTLAGVLQKAGIGAADAYRAVAAVEEYYDPRKIKPGQAVKVSFDPGSADGEGYRFSELQIEIDPLTSVALKRTDGDGFESSKLEKQAIRKIYAGRAEITDTLYGAAHKAGIPASVTAQALRIFSWDIDFQRDLRKGDVLDVMYDQMETPEGMYVKGGDILYARLFVNGQDMPVYRYETRDGDVDYYTAKGTSIRKALLQTPIDGARISSGFGMRKHPVLGYSKMHKGMDFAAPRGTPVYAAGDGTVEKASPFSSYGNYVRIRHTGGLKTAYAHLNGFAKGVKAGSRVRQGQIIGYVGSTGRSTGPHLHYEVLQNGAQINPKSVKVQQGKALSGQELAAFKTYVEALDRQYAALTRRTTLALGKTEAAARTAVR